MSKLPSFRTACWATALLAAAGCSSQKPAVYEHENFDDSGTFSRNYPVTDAAPARRRVVPCLARVTSLPAMTPK